MTKQNGGKDKLHVSLNGGDIELVDDLVEKGIADTRSEAIRRCIKAGYPLLLMRENIFSDKQLISA